MGRMGRKRQDGSEASRVSHIVLTVLIAATAVMFGAFYTVGYTLPYAADTKFNAPLLTDALLVFVYVMLGMAALLTLFGVTGLVRKLRGRVPRGNDKKDGDV